MYENGTYTVKICNRLSESFSNIKSKQGCCMSHTHYRIYLNEFVKEFLSFLLTTKLYLQEEKCF